MLEGNVGTSMRAVTAASVILAQAEAAAKIGKPKKKPPKIVGKSGVTVSITEAQAEAQRRYNRNRNKNQRANVQWRRLKDNFDELVAKAGANPEIGSVVTRWVLYGHLSKPEGLAGRLVGEIIGRYERYWNAHGLTRTSRSQSYERGTGGMSDEIARHEANGTLREYERRAKRAKKRYEKLCSIIMSRFGDAAWETIVEVCVSDREVDTRLRADVAVVLRVVAREFGLIEAAGRKRRHAWRDK